MQIIDNVFHEDCLVGMQKFLTKVSTAIAALREGRKFIGFELDDYYYNMCLERIAEEKDFIEKQKSEPVQDTLF